MFLLCLHLVCVGKWVCNVNADRVTGVCMWCDILAAGGVTSFKATDKKVVNKVNPQPNQQDPTGSSSSSGSGEALPWHKMQNLGDMEGTWDGWVLLLSFSLSLITSIVGVFQMVEKPYTAQVRGCTAVDCC